MYYGDNPGVLEELQLEAQTTKRVLERVPEKHLGWKPHEKSMTLGQLAMHIALVPGAIAELSTQPGFDISTNIPRPQATSVGGLLATLEQSIGKARSILQRMDDAQLSSLWRMVDGEREIMAIPRQALLRTVMLNHWYHHRGQLSVYLRQTGVLLPSTYGPRVVSDFLNSGSYDVARDTMFG